jgi:hypothetical protein
MNGNVQEGPSGPDRLPVADPALHRAEPNAVPADAQMMDALHSYGRASHGT